jgi:hypothetical protein
MKVRLIITARGWAYKLHARRDDQGEYYVHLADQGGQPLKHGPILGIFQGLDLVVRQAPEIYAALLAKVPPASPPPPPANPISPNTQPIIP